MREIRALLPTLLALVIAIAVGSSAAAAPLGSVVEFSAPAGAVPFRISSGADGNLWYSDQGAVKAIGRMSTSGANLSGYNLPAGSFPRQVRVGSDGNFWFTDTGTPAIGRITTDGTMTLFNLPAGSVPNALAVGADGNMWVTDRGASPAIVRVTPSGTMTRFSSGLNAGSLPNGIAPGADGNVWFTDQGPTRAIGQITPAGTITEFTAGLNPGTNPAALAPGPDGNIWFTDQGTTRAIGRVAPAGTIVELNTGLNPGSNPQEITPGADGNLWFTDRGTTKAVGRVTPSGGTWTITNYTQPAASLPGGVRTGADGNLWFIDNNAAGQALGQFGVGAPAASVTAPGVAGGGNLGAAQTCQGATWSNWAGSQPSLDAYGFDGYRWLRDGSPIAGQTTQSYTPTAADVGHQLSCKVTATYTLFPVTTSATSAAVLVKGAAEQLTDLAAAVEGVGPGDGLANKVAGAQEHLAHGRIPGTCHSLNTFIQKARALSGEKIPAAQATALIADADRIRAVLDC